MAARGRPAYSKADRQQFRIIGHRLRQFRRGKYSFSQSGLARRVKVSRSLISRIERGLHPPSTRVLRGLKKVFAPEDIAELAWTKPMSKE